MASLEKAFEGLTEGGGLTALAVGAGILFLAPGILPVLGRAIRPLAVGAIRTGMTVYNQASSTVRETTDDLMAEARAELAAEDRGAAADAEPGRRRGRATEQPA
jgi:hypothetical protein